MTPPRIAVIGCGFIGTVHSFALKALIDGGLTGARVVAVCDHDPDRARRAARGHPGAVATTDPGEALAAADIAWICTPTASHVELVEQAARRGVAVYCEKPLAPDLPGAERAAAAVADAGVPHQVGLVLRHCAPFASLASVVAGSPVGGAPATEPVGAPMAAVFRDDQYFPVQGMYGSTWRSDVAVSGGGTLLEHSIHDLDVLRWVLGPVATVTARTANHAGHLGVEDVAAVTLVHESGATSSLVSVWHEVLSRPSTRRLEVFCRHAVVVLEDEDAGPVHVERPEGRAEIGLSADILAFAGRLPVEESLRLPILAYARADHAFLDAVTCGGSPAPGFEVGLDAHRLADAAYRSAALGGLPLPVG